LVSDLSKKLKLIFRNKIYAMILGGYGWRKLVYLYKITGNVTGYGSNSMKKSPIEE